ncbi:MAG: hypothetical protein NUV59_00735 [Patescibacteria group bacterium]|nr:hypothetical protein [Patescibacteria group bacterium]
MAFIGEHEQRGVIGTDNIRSLFSDLAGGDFHEWLDGFCGYWGISRFLVLSIFFFGLLSILWIQIPNLPLFTLEWLIGLAPVWMPIAALIAAWKVWIWYAQSLYISKIDPVLLEVKIPRELVRSPRAMENALSKFWTDSGVTTFLNRVWQGQVTPFFSLELASFGGEVHFYIWCWRGWRSVVESAIYAYYPEVEIVEAEDYAMRFRYDPDKHEVFGTDWRLEPRNDAYPIRTYVDFEIDEDPKEEYKIDPFAEVLERLSTLKPTEQMWLQIIITMCRDTRHVPGAPWWKTESRYTGTLKSEIEKIREEAVGDVESEPWRRSVRIPQARQTELIRDIDRNMGKHPFNVVSRGVYIADPENFGSPGYTGIRWIWRPFGNPQYANQLRPRRWGNPFDWPWQDLYDKRWIMHHRRFFDAYRRRCAFHSPWVTPHNMLSTEALASIWHPPSRSITAPGLDRLPAKKAEPPMDLPM